MQILFSQRICGQAAAAADASIHKPLATKSEIQRGKDQVCSY